MVHKAAANSASLMPARAANHTTSVRNTSPAVASFMQAYVIATSAITMHAAAPAQRRTSNHWGSSCEGWSKENLMELARLHHSAAGLVAWVNDMFCDGRGERCRAGSS